MLSKYLKYKQKYFKLKKGGAAQMKVEQSSDYAMHIEQKQEVAKIVPFSVSDREIKDFGLKKCCLTYLTFGKKMVNDLFKYEKLIFQRFLGKGGVGLAIEFLTPEGKKLAIKGIFPRLDIDSTLQRNIAVSEYINSEIAKCGQNGQFILNYEYMGDIDGIKYFKSEVLDKDFFDFYHQLNDVDFASKKELMKTIITQLINGIYCFHLLGITYGDLKPENIFINENPFILKFADLDGIGYKGNPVHSFTINYAFLNVNRPNEVEQPDDIFSLAIIILFVCQSNIAVWLIEKLNLYKLTYKTTELSFSKNTSEYQQVVANMTNEWKTKILGKYNAAIDKSPTISPNLKPILKRMLSINKSERPTAAELKLKLDANELF